jgi:hypothetical protein
MGSFYYGFRHPVNPFLTKGFLPKVIFRLFSLPAGWAQTPILDTKPAV